MNIPLPELPVQQALPELCDMLAHRHAVLSAPPGSGKTTIVPLALLEQDWLAGRKILILEPRRPAARLAARRMAAIANTEVGDLVGYQVRMDRRIGAQTRIEVVTEGILTRRLQVDPELSDVGLVIFDEFHERHLQADLGLALCLDVCAGLRDDLRLLVMSATLDPGPLCDLLDAGHVSAPGRQYPIEIEHLPATDRRQPLQAMSSLVQQAIQRQSGDVLVFLPGKAEIKRLAEQLETFCSQHRVRLEKLFGDLSATEQDRILAPPVTTQQRVILSTDLAESSVTLIGVTCVVDSGLARKPQFDPNSGMTRLQLLPISQASAEQRAGRAGRTAPGLCLRAWSDARHARLSKLSPPEIISADLAGLVLELASWGVNQPSMLAWVDVPPAAHWQQATELLQSLGALDAEGLLSATGRSMAMLGLEPRLARLMIAARNRQQAQSAADLAALLSERDPLSGQLVGADLGLRLQLLEALRQGKVGGLPGGVDKGRLHQLSRLSDALCSRHALIDPPLDPPLDPNDIQPAYLLAQAFPDRIAQQRTTGDPRYLLANGRGALLDPSDGLIRDQYLVVASLDGGQREARIWMALPISLADLRSALVARIRQLDECVWDEQRQAVVARRVEQLGALVLSEQPGELDPVQASQLLMAQLQANWPAGLTWNSESRQLQARLQRMRDLYPDQDWPDVSDRYLQQTLPDWLGPWLDGLSRFSEVAKIDLQQALLSLLDWSQQQQLQACLPSHYQSPAGSRRMIDYLAEGAPKVSLPLAEVFGQRENPSLAAGRQPLLLELLNPAGRPLQITADLGRFWRGAYPEVRKELRGRYPKHDWPEDPASAPARIGTGRVRR